MAIEHEECRRILDDALLQAEDAFLRNECPPTGTEYQSACDIIFESKTRAYREVLLGCLLGKVLDPSTDIHLPYVDHGPNAFSGRSLDERVVNPFLREKGVPCSRGPYLSCFRRNVKFDRTTRQGLKDKAGYDALLNLLDRIDAQHDKQNLLLLLQFVVYRFVLLREQSKVDLASLERLSLTQYKRLVRGLLERQSGGVFPVILVVAMMEAIVQRFSLRWNVSFQGINVADKASGAAGDISLIEQESGNVILTLEVTERPVDVHRVRATFTEKVASAKIHDYVFLVHLKQIGEDVKQQAERYFAQGYDVNFVDIEEWLVNTLVTVGIEGRQKFKQSILHLLAKADIPKALRIAWNQEIGALLA